MSKLPEHASLEYLKKVAKERLRVLRTQNPKAQLAAAQLDVAREHGFPSWRALKAEIERRQAPVADRFFAACRAGDVAALRALLVQQPELVRERGPDGSTALHVAVGHPECVRLLLERGADPNARDTGDNALPLHFAAAIGNLEVVRALLDAGSDVHGSGDVHKGDVIGWAVGDAHDVSNGVLDLLLQRGARHHIFSAIALGDRDLVQSVVGENPNELRRRRSRFEEEQTPLHFALAAPTGLATKPAQYDMADLLIELGADVDAEDAKGRTPLAVAMLRGDLEAMRRLKAAGAKEPPVPDASAVQKRMDELRESIKRVVPMLCVADVGAAVAWYVSLGFTIYERVPETGPIDFAYMTMGSAHLMVQSLVKRPRNQIALWFFTNRIEELYQLLKSRQLQAAQAAMAGRSAEHPELHFSEDLYEPFYGGKQFSVSDVNGFEVVFKSD